MVRRDVVCPHCQHKQKSKSELKNITCSSCQKKFNPQETPINNIPTGEQREQSALEIVDRPSTPEELKKETEETKKVKLD